MEILDSKTAGPAIKPLMKPIPNSAARLMPGRWRTNDAPNTEPKNKIPPIIQWLAKNATRGGTMTSPPEAVATATAEATTPTADYLMGMPHLAENLEAGLDALGVDVSGEEEDFL